jgi:TnpA family transposase
MRGVLRKLSAYPRQDGLALALKELKKLERTLVTLQCFQEPELRRRNHVGRNKGEQQNALRRAVFVNRLGELRDRTCEHQRHRTSGLKLIVSAITLWNTRARQRAVDYLKEPGYHR